MENKLLASMKYRERVEYELAIINASGIDYVTVGEEENGIIDMILTGPKNTPYEDLIYNFQFHLNKFESMPLVTFNKEKMFHANVFDETGEVCLGNLDWNQEMTIGSVLNCLTHLIGNPNYYSCANQRVETVSKSNRILTNKIKKMNKTNMQNNIFNKK